jgi:hypothetical protein
MKALFHLLFFVSCLCVFKYQALAKDDLVLLPTLRQKTIVQLKNNLFFDRESMIGIIQSMRTPFLFRDQLPSTVYVPLAPGAPVYSDEMALKYVMKKLNPKGLMIKDNQKILLVEGGQLALGDQFEVNIQGTVYSVFLEALTFENFTLRLNSFTLTQPFRLIDQNKLHFNTP